jgi:hypothetical protein
VVGNIHSYTILSGGTVVDRGIRESAIVSDSEQEHAKVGSDA